MGARVLLSRIGFWFLLLTSGIASSQTIGALQVAPKSTPAGSGATVFAVAQITAPEVIASSINLQKIDAQGRATIIGTLRDDGTEGDATANDRLFTLRFSVFEQNPVTLTYRVSAAVQGKVTRIFSAPATFAVTGTVGTGISITQPANLVFTNISPVTVSGSTGDPGATVRVNGILATKGGTTFQASVPLQEGNNTLTAVAENTNKTQSTASVQVTLDTTPPKVTVDSPPSGFTTTDASITVTGMVNDIVVGTVNDKQAQVTVGGVAAQVSNRTFTATPVLLQIGLNTIPVIARDQTGNSATLNIRITREAPIGSVIKIISGNNQSGTIGSALAAPLVVQLLDGTTPLANNHVFFKITENDGFLQPGTGKPRLVTVISDAQGKAQATLSLGNRAGGGNNTVEAYASNVKGTAIFTASGKSKGASHVNVDSGTNQFGAVNQALPLPFVVVVTDEGFNRLPGVPVTFTVRQGNGSINGVASIQTVTDSDGRALATLKLGTQPGQDNNVVEVTFTGNAGLPAAFTASGKVPGNPALTTISGVVQDNSNNPISNVTMRVFKTNQGTANNQPVEVGTPVKTDAKGLFKITSAPVGFFKLMADGTTATQAGKQFPTLEYDIVTVAGQDNGVGSPIYLPELDPNAKLCVDATTGGVLKLSKSPGFSLSIAPGSATFPGGSKTGCVTVTPVNPDKVPMVPGFGQQPRFVVTIQPVGTTFNPPAAISMPNMDGLAPNAKTEMYSFDHDLASFVAIGTGTVSQDGSTIVSDPGVGVIKAGWHCGGNPNTTGSAGTCPECKKCEGSGCVADAGQNGQPSASDGCKNCQDGSLVPKGCQDCQKCEGGNCIADASRNGQPAPNDKCKTCQDGALKPIDIDTTETEVAITFGTPAPAVDKINKTLGELNSIGVIASVNLLQITGKVKTKECCEATTGKGRSSSGSVSGNFGGFTGKGKIWPLGPIPTFGPKTIDVFGLAELTVKAQFVGGVFLGLSGNLTGEIGRRQNDCSKDPNDRAGCFFATLNSTITPSLSAEAGGNASLTYDCFFCEKTTISGSGSLIFGEFSWPINITTVSYNAKTCTDGLAGGFFQPGSGAFKIAAKFSGSYKPEGGTSRSFNVTLNFLACTISLSGVTCS